MIGSNVKLILLNEWILFQCGVPSGRVCAYSLCSMLVSIQVPFKPECYILLLLSAHIERLGVFRLRDFALNLS